MVIKGGNPGTKSGLQAIRAPDLPVFPAQALPEYFCKEQAVRACALSKYSICPKGKKGLRRSRAIRSPI
jgi:hypothetical protein